MKIKSSNLAVAVLCFGVGIMMVANDKDFFALIEFSLAALNVWVGALQ